MFNFQNKIYCKNVVGYKYAAVSHTAGYPNGRMSDW